MVIFYKRRGQGYFVQEPKISSQYLGVGKTKKEAIKDFNDSLRNIFSNPKDRSVYKLKSNVKGVVKRIV